MIIRTSETEAQTPIKTTTGWRIVNALILLLHIVFPVWIFALMYTFAITPILFAVAFFSSLTLGAVYNEVKFGNKDRRILYAARIFAVSACILSYLPTAVLLNFEQTELMYPLKRICYTRGVYGSNGAYYESLLPASLPDRCEDYSFRTQGSMVAQDYHASSYLTLYTDTETLDSFAAYYDTLDCERFRSDADDEDIQRDFLWFCGQMRLEDTFFDGNINAVLYWFDDSYPKAILLDYDSGLFAVLT